MIIRDIIDFYLENKIYDHVTVTGLDGSGKTTMMSPLIGKYDYLKTNWVSPYLMQLMHCKYYKLFDRNPLIDRFVYLNLDMKDKVDYESCINYVIESLNKYFKNTLYVIYLHDRFRSVKSDEPDYVDKSRDEILKRYTLLSNKMIESGFPVVIVKEDSFQRFN